MSEFVRDALPSHGAIEAAPLPTELAPDEDPRLTFQPIRESRRFMAVISAIGGLSLLVPPDASPVETASTGSHLPPGRSASAYAEAKQFGILEDRVKQHNVEDAYVEMKKVADTGAEAVKITAQWVTGQTVPSEKDMTGFKNAVEAANQFGLKVIVSAYPCSHIDKECKQNSPPLNQWERGKFTNWLASLAYNLPDVQDFVIGNEINSWGFWWPQRYPDGSYAAAENYFKLLASSYDVLKKAAAKREGGKDITVYGLALSSKGTTPPLRFLEKFRKAYLASGRKKPILDVVSFHPYPEDSSELPDARHKNGFVGVSDYQELVRGLQKAFMGTPQARTRLLIAYDEYGVQTKIPPIKNHLYKGKEPSNTHAVTEAEQAKNLSEALNISACQPKVVSFTQFLDRDEPNKARWQSGLRYADGTPKSSLSKLKPAIEGFQAGDDQC